MVDPVQFLARATPRYKERGIYPYCDACHEIVHLYGAHSTNPGTIPRFDHPDLPPDADPLDDCVLANRNPRLRGLSPDGYDDVRGKRIRDQFLDSGQLSQAYAFCLDLCRTGNLPAAKFRSMFRRADRKRVWSYSGIQSWAIPYVLLTLETSPPGRKREGIRISLRIAETSRHQYLCALVAQPGMPPFQGVLERRQALRGARQPVPCLTSSVCIEGWRHLMDHPGVPACPDSRGIGTGGNDPSCPMAPRRP